MNQPSIEQLLNLADRAEYGGGLTQAEADRLRAGLGKLHDDKQSLQNRLRVRTRRYNEAASELRGIHRLVAHAHDRGQAAIPTWAVDAYLSPNANREAA